MLTREDWHTLVLVLLYLVIHPLLAVQAIREVASPHPEHRYVGGLEDPRSIARDGEW